MIRNLEEARLRLAEIIKVQDGKRQVMLVTVEIATCIDHEARKFLSNARERLIELQSKTGMKPAAPRKPSTSVQPRPDQGRTPPAAPPKTSAAPNDPHRPAPSDAAPRPARGDSSGAPAAPSRPDGSAAKTPPAVSKPAAQQTIRKDQPGQQGAQAGSPEKAKAQEKPLPARVQPRVESEETRPPKSIRREQPASAHPSPPLKQAPLPETKMMTSGPGAANPFRQPPRPTEPIPVPRPTESSAAQHKIAPARPTTAGAKEKTGPFKDPVKTPEDDDADIPVLTEDRILDDEFPLDFDTIEDLDRLSIAPGLPPAPPPKRVLRPIRPLSVAPPPTPARAGPPPEQPRMSRPAGALVKPPEPEAAAAPPAKTFTKTAAPPVTAIRIEPRPIGPGDRHADPAPGKEKTPEAPQSAVHAAPNPVKTSGTAASDAASPAPSAAGMSAAAPKPARIPLPEPVLPTEQPETGRGTKTIGRVGADDGLLSVIRFEIESDDAPAHGGHAVPSPANALVKPGKDFQEHDMDEPDSEMIGIPETETETIITPVSGKPVSALETAVFTTVVRQKPVPLPDGRTSPPPSKAPADQQKPASGREIAMRQPVETGRSPRTPEDGKSPTSTTAVSMAVREIVSGSDDAPTCPPRPAGPASAASQLPAKAGAPAVSPADKGVPADRVDTTSVEPRPAPKPLPGAGDGHTGSPGPAAKPVTPPMAAAPDENAPLPKNEMEVFNLLRTLFNNAYRNVPSSILASAYKENPSEIARLVSEAMAVRDKSSAAFSDIMGQIYRETLAVKVRHGMLGKKVGEFLETVARRSGWRIGGKAVDSGMLEEACVGIILNDRWKEECVLLMRGGQEARERSPRFLSRILSAMVKGF